MLDNLAHSILYKAATGTFLILGSALADPSALGLGHWLINAAAALIILKAVLDIVDRFKNRNNPLVECDKVDLSHLATKGDIDHLATREHLANLKSRLREDISSDLSHKLGDVYERLNAIDRQVAHIQGRIEH